MSKVGHELVNVPFSDLICNMAFAIAESQKQLDLASIEILKEMADGNKNPVDLSFIGLGSKTSMLGAGFQPSFYQFAETVLEVKMTINLSQETIIEKTTEGKQNKKKLFSVNASSINAKYTNTYNFNQEGSSLIRTKIVPVPPSQVVQAIIDKIAKDAMIDIPN